MEHFFKVGDKVICKSRPMAGPATIKSIFSKVYAQIMYEDGSREGVGVIYLLPYVDPRDAEIAQLKARLALIDKQHDACVEVTKRSMHSEAYDRLWATRLEQLYLAVTISRSPAFPNHAETDARQNDNVDARDAGQGTN